MKAAFYDYTHWVKPKNGILDMMPSLSIPLSFELAHYEDADIIFIDFGGNADHIPFFAEMFDKFPNKKFVIWAGENLRRQQPLIPKKISTKASNKNWARKLFPYLYLPAHALFPQPCIKEDLYLYKLLEKHKHNSNVISLLCEKADDLGGHSHHYPLFVRRLIPTYVSQKMLSLEEYSEKKVLNHIKKIMLSMTPQVYRDGVFDESRNIYSSIVFSNTIKERVIAYNKITQVGDMLVYGKNPYYTGKLLEDRETIYAKSRYVVCLENSSARGYFTEKLFDVTSYGAIPIYWGDPEVEQYCNKEAMILCKTLQDIKNLDKSVRDTDSKLKEISHTPYYLPEHIENIYSIYAHTRNIVLDFVNG